MARCARPNDTRANARATAGWIRALRFGVCLPLVLGSLWTAVAAYAAAQPLHITLDAGHGGSEIGASYRFADGVVLEEKTLTLRVALRVRQLLEQAGFLVTLTRSSDTPVNTAGLDLNGDGQVGLADELQARVDIANLAGSDLFVSICFNGSSDPAVSGTETFWNPNRSFSDRSQRLADLTQMNMVADLAAAGYKTHDRGARTDASLLGGDALFLLGPKSRIIARPSQMPAILGESLFLTNPADATALRDDRIVEAVARGYFDGVRAYTRSAASGAAASASVTTTAPGRPAAAAQTQKRWTVSAITYPDTPAGQRLAVRAMRSLSAGGLPATLHAVARTGSTTLSGYVVVASGSFATRQSALARRAQVRQAGYSDAYVTAIGN
jgi:N-acetylmuramoyl-L-alanine amidase